MSDNDTDDEEFTLSMTNATPAKKPRLEDRSITWAYDGTDFKLMTPAYILDKMADETHKLRFGFSPNFLKKNSGGAEFKKGVFALKFRPKTEEEPDRHTGYFMSEKECILQHRGSLATIYQELKNYAEEHKIIFTQVVHAVCNPSIALIPLTKFLDRLRIVSSCQIGGHGVLTSSSTIRVAWRSHPARA